MMNAGKSANITLSTLVNDGMEVKQLSTNSSIHWHSPSNIWIQTGAIAAESDFYLINTINWNVTGLLVYEHDHYAFKADDYSTKGDELFLAKGHGRYESNSAVSW